MQHTPRLSALSLAIASLFTVSAHADEAAPQEMQTVEVTSAHLRSARIELSPKVGTTIYSIDSHMVDMLGQGDNTPFNEVLLRLPGVSQDSKGSGASAERAMLNHGFKAVQIGTSAWTAEALKNTMPASVFSRSTECHNQDKVSMGTIAARDAIRVLELTEQVAAATLLAAHQGVWLRSRAEDARPLPPALAQMHAELAKDFAPVVEDRALEAELRLCLSRIAQQHWRLHA